LTRQTAKNIQSLRWLRLCPVKRSVLICALLMLIGSGCARNRYYANRLPRYLQAQRVENPQTIDFTGLAMAPERTDIIDHGDVIEVSISASLSQEDTNTFPVRVNEQGIAVLPTIGPVELAGLELEGAEARIRMASINGGIFTNPHVTVTMKQQRMNRVTVIGAVEEPGVYSLPRGTSDLLAAIVAAGGISEDAGPDVEIRQPHSTLRPIPARSPQDKFGHLSVAQANHQNAALNGKSQNIKVNLVSAAKSNTGGYYINDGGIVMVTKRDPQPVHVIGLVKNPGRHEYPVAEELRVLDAIALAGGVSLPMADKIFVLRRIEGQSKPAVIQISMRAAKVNGEKNNLLLAPGDVVSVEQTPGTMLLQVIQILRIGIGASLGTLF